MAAITCNICGAVNPSNATYCRTCGSAMQVANAGAGNNFNTATGRLLPNSLLKQRYRVLSSVGKGGMGAVYLAEDTQLGNRKVALKEMSQKGMSAQDVSEAADNFKKEAHILAGLQHFHLPSIYDHFSESGRWYLVMSFIQGETLDDYIKKAPGQRLPLKEVLEVGIQLCTVLDYLHNQSPPIIFRDLKPSNIMRTPDGHLYLIDFGIARHFKPGQTRDTAVYGSAGYSSPEQYGQAQTTQRSDIYSLGAVLHQLLSGRHPATTPFRFPPLQSAGQSIPAELEALITQMVSVDENQRPSNVAAVKRELQRIASGSSASAPTTYVSGYTPTVYAQQAAPAMQQQHQIFASPALQRSAPKASSVWHLGRQQWVAIAVGTVLCGLLELWLDHLFSSNFFSPWWSFNLGNIPVSVDGYLALTCATLVITFYFAANYGPWVGLIVGGVGTLGADLISGNGLVFWYWDIALAIAGFLIGLTLLRASRKYHTARNIGFIVRIGALAIIIFTAIGELGNAITYHSTRGETFIFILVYTVMYGVISLIVLAILLKIYNSVVRGRTTP